MSRMMPGIYISEQLNDFMLKTYFASAKFCHQFWNLSYYTGKKYLIYDAILGWINLYKDAGIKSTQTEQTSDKKIKAKKSYFYPNSSTLNDFLCIDSKKIRLVLENLATPLKRTFLVDALLWNGLIENPLATFKKVS